MADRPASFGRLAAQAVSPAALLTLEEREGRGDQFAMIDALIADLLRRERILALERGHEATAVALLGIKAKQRQVITAHFTLAQQQARGAWVLPEAATLEADWASLPSYFAAHPRFATGIAAEEQGKVVFQSSADALFVWAVLEPDSL